MKRALALLGAGLLVAGLVRAAALPQGMPQPTSQHEALKREVGTWDAVVKMMAPGQPPSEGKATNTISMIGSFWMIEEFKGEFMGMPFQGHGTIGYDPRKQKYVGTWVDSMSDFLAVMEGTGDPAGKVVTMTYEAPNQNGPGMAKHRDVREMKDADTMTLKMYETGADGKEAQTMEITYKRRKT